MVGAELEVETVAGLVDCWEEMSRVPNISVNGFIRGPPAVTELLRMICRARRPATTRLSFDFLSSKVRTSKEWVSLRSGHAFKEDWHGWSLVQNAWPRGQLRPTRGGRGG